MEFIRADKPFLSDQPALKSLWGTLNLDEGTLTLDGGTLTLDGGTRPPYNLSTACTTRGPRPAQFKFNNLFNEHFSGLIYFSKVFCRVKTGEVKVNFYWKMAQYRWLRLLTMLLLGPALHCAEPLALWGISLHLSSKCSWRPKKVLLSERRAPCTVPYGKSIPGYYIMFKKRLEEGLN